MATRGYIPLAAILITICLNISSVVVAAAAVAWDPRTSRYDSYNLDKGPVIYEAYYPDARDTYQDKRFDRSAVLERSFQVPFKRLAYSAEPADRPVTSNESSFVVMDSEEPGERRETPESRRNYDTADKTARFPDEPSTVFNDDDKFESAKVEEISKLVRRAISRDLENWNALERYLDHTANQDPPIAQLAVNSGENRRNKEGNSYSFPVNRQYFDSSQPSDFELLRKLKENARPRPVYLERADVNENARRSAMSIGDTQADAPAIDVISDPLPLENIFQPRPQVIRYMFFKEPVPQLEQVTEVIDNFTPRSYGDNLIRKEIANNSRDKQTEENVKVTSIEVSELPRHKTRHHHGEWPKRDYSAHHRRSQAAA